MLSRVKNTGLGERIVAVVWHFLPQSARERLARELRGIQQRAGLRVPPSNVFILRDAQIVSEVLPAVEQTSLLTTCRNESASVDDFLHSLILQSKYPRELIICDGGSTDDTVAKVLAWKSTQAASSSGLPFRLVLLQEAKCSIARGRNLAAAAASGDYLLFTDMGCKLDPMFVEKMIAGFCEEQVDVVMGWYAPVATSAIAQALAVYLIPQRARLDVSTFLPSGRSVAMRKTTFRRTGGYPEFLTMAGEDSLMGLYLKSAAREFAFVDEPLVKWQMPSSAKALWKMIARYAQGDAEGGALFWEHYFILETVVAYSMVEIVLGLNFLVFAAGFGWWWALVSAILFSSTAVRLTRFLRCFSVVIPQSGNSTDTLPYRRALLLMLSAQAYGFAKGYLQRRAVTARRLNKPSQRFCLLVAPSDSLNGRIERERRLSEGWFVFEVATTGNKDMIFPRPEYHARLSWFLRSEFDPQAWSVSLLPFAAQSGVSICVIDGLDEKTAAESVPLSKAVAQLKAFEAGRAMSSNTT